MWIDSGQFYALNDQSKDAMGMFGIPGADAHSWNKKGYGIFWTVNSFDGKRQIVNLTQVNGWVVDMDNGTKQEMLVQIKKGLVPSMVVETKRGYHVYFKAKDGTKENWNLIIKNYLVPFYHSDRNAVDLARVLRRPGFLHMKDPTNPFLIKTVWEHDVQYSEKEMILFYESRIKTAKKAILEKKQTRIDSDKKWRKLYGPFWEQVKKIDCESALNTLSGTEYVQFETYKFSDTGSGKKNIYVNGNSTACWIDQEGLIGSSSGGGPTIAQWLNWFHKDYSKTIQIIKEVFPQCKN